MATARGFLSGVGDATLEQKSLDERSDTSEDALPARQLETFWRQDSNWPEDGRSGLHACASTEAEIPPPTIVLSSGIIEIEALAQTHGSCLLRIQAQSNLKETIRELADRRVNSMIFTDRRPPDRDWEQLLQMARRSSVPAEVIVVSKFADVQLDLNIIELGAFDFVVPPFRVDDPGYTIVSAFYSCLSRPRTEPSLNSQIIMAASPVQTALPNVEIY